jgi:hypothetical protein
MGSEGFLCWSSPELERVIFELAEGRSKNQIPNTKFQIPNKSQITIWHDPYILFGILSIRIYLEFGAWDLVLI